MRPRDASCYAISAKHPGRSSSLWTAHTKGTRPGSSLLDLGFIPVVPPKQNRVTAWEYNRAMYKRRNEIERLFRRLKGFRRIFSRFEKLDLMFIAFINFALIADGLRIV
jgi:hypothetical protein